MNETANQRVEIKFEGPSGEIVLRGESGGIDKHKFCLWIDIPIDQIKTIKVIPTKHRTDPAEDEETDESEDAED